MVSLITLKYLKTQKIKDANILFKNERNNGAIYLMGYAIELSLKRKISQTLNFTHGFPETNNELYSYASQLNIFNAISTGVQLNQIKQIRNHNLQQLLVFSGAEARIKSIYYTEWLIVSVWKPENRYIMKRNSWQRTNDFMKAAKIIIKQIS